MACEYVSATLSKLRPVERRFRPHLVPLRATTEERELIRQAAAERGLSVAALIRYCLREQAVPLPPESP